MTDSPQHLFVYGTLMQAASGWRIGRAERDRLHRQSTFVGPAIVRGYLYDLGNYPGLRLTDDPGGVVHGEVVLLADAERSFRWLDPYENIVPGNHSHNEYRRVVVPVKVVDGPELAAWLYVYNWDVGGRPPVPGGRWLVQR